MWSCCKTDCLDNNHQLILIPTKVTFQHAEQSINNIIMLKTYVSAIKPVFEALMTAQSDLLQVIRDVSASPSIPLPPVPLIVAYCGLLKHRVAVCAHQIRNHFETDKLDDK